MAEYIEREALMAEIEANINTYWNEGHGGYYLAEDAINESVKTAPAADVVEVRHGEWVYPSYAPYGGSYQMRHCSLCEYSPPYIEDIIYEPYSHYCPNCGAKMDGKGEGE